MKPPHAPGSFPPESSQTRRKWNHKTVLPPLLPRCVPVERAVRAGAGGAIGGLIGVLTGMGIPEYEAKRYARARVARDESG